VEGAVVDGRLADDDVAGEEVAAVGAGAAEVQHRARGVGGAEVLGAGRGVGHPDAAAEQDQLGAAGGVADPAVAPGTAAFFAEGFQPLLEVAQLRFHRDDDGDGLAIAHGLPLLSRAGGG
jgi:hypothetical protein